MELAVIDLRVEAAGRKKLGVDPLRASTPSRITSIKPASRTVREAAMQ